MTEAAKRYARHIRVLCLQLLVGVVLVGIAPIASQAQSFEHATKGKILAALPKLEEAAQQVIANGGVPGISIAVVYQDEVVYLKGFGVREEGKSDLVDADTVFQLASFSKPMASTVVAAIVSEGVASWDSRIVDIDPSFQLYDAYPTAQVTVRDLFSHRSGLPGGAGNELEEIGYDRDAILQRLRQVKPSSSFRSEYSYSNFGLTAGAVAVAKAAGMSWENAADAKLYKPLGMSSTSSRYADFLTRTNRATLHVPLDGKWRALAKRDPDPQSPAGGVSSDARDLAQWMRLQLGNGNYNGKPLIDGDAIGQTHLPLMARGKNPVSGGWSFYGLGWNVEYGRYGEGWSHAGAFSTGARTLVSLLPAEELGIVVLTNAFPTGVPEGLADTFFELVMTGKTTQDWVIKWNNIYGQLFGPAIEAAIKRYGTPPVSPLPALPLSAYAGTYFNPYIGKAVVAEKDGTLEIRLGPEGKAVFPLSHFDRDLYTYRPSAEMPNMPVAVTFEIGSDQKAAQVKIDDLNEFELGVLTRIETDRPAWP
ncbi:CubicO group peptidase (beta-lactamase class C family) [Phyllobacterium trifolii]|uniref:CubicO group peptidase (Beta-lactamase class C family) n=1 Tax=Phyllobacterium trifolii TaxID=300193 RepID=A0A839UI35_9HYPH|nr:serine hydrolase [Phyllobacterium trifolii]MBB3149443.1 CubicO group peptidase (beta-lactamase class C family) [Phyllobacterium trifolii]